MYTIESFNYQDSPVFSTVQEATEYEEQRMHKYFADNPQLTSRQVRELKSRQFRKEFGFPPGFEIRQRPGSDVDVRQLEGDRDLAVVTGRPRLEVRFLTGNWQDADEACCNYALMKPSECVRVHSYIVQA